MYLCTHINASQSDITATFHYSHTTDTANRKFESNAKKCVSMSVFTYVNLREKYSAEKKGRQCERKTDEYKRRLVSFNKAAFIACHSRMKNECDLRATSQFVWIEHVPCIHTHTHIFMVKWNFVGFQSSEFSRYIW